MSCWSLAAGQDVPAPLRPTAQPRHHWLAAYQHGAPPRGSGRMVSSLWVCLLTTRLSPRGSSADGGIRPRAQKGPQRSCVRGISLCHGLEGQERIKHPLGTFSQAVPTPAGEAGAPPRLPHHCNPHPLAQRRLPEPCCRPPAPEPVLTGVPGPLTTFLFFLFGQGKQEKPTLPTHCQRSREGWTGVPGRSAAP